eukprot:6096201-Ditylum_brightwellii.AAC.1
MTKAEYLQSVQAGKKKAIMPFRQAPNLPIQPPVQAPILLLTQLLHPTINCQKVHQKQMKNKLPPRVLQKNLLGNLPALRQKT